MGQHANVANGYACAECGDAWAWIGESGMVGPSTLFKIFIHMALLAVICSAKCVS